MATAMTIDQLEESIDEHLSPDGTDDAEQGVDAGEATEATAEEEASEEPPAEETPYSRLEQAHYEEIRGMERTVRDKERDYLRSKSETSALKKAFECSDEGLRNLIAEGPQQQMKLPLADAEEPQAEEAWRAMPLAEAGIAGAMETKLAEADITTIGQLADFTASGCELTEIDGIGPAKAEEIADLLTEFWKKHPELCGGDAEPNEAESFAQRLRESDEWANSGTFARDVEDDTFFEAGCKAFEEGVPVGECPWTEEEGHDWIRGYVASEIEAAEDAAIDSDELEESEVPAIEEPADEEPASV